MSLYCIKNEMLYFSVCSFSFYFYYNESNIPDPRHPEKAFFYVSLKYPGQSDSVQVWHSKFASLTPKVWHRQKIWLGRIPRPFQLWITSKEYYHKGVQFQAIGQLDMGQCGQFVKPQDHCFSSNGYFECKNKVCTYEVVLFY